jgi:hypothetical protein
LHPFIQRFFLVFSVFFRAPEGKIHHCINPMAERQINPTPPSQSVLQPLNDAWSLMPATPKAARRGARNARSAASGHGDEQSAWPKGMPTDGFEVLEEAKVQAAPGRRMVEGAASSNAPLKAEVSGDAIVLLIARQESGAISFHLPVTVAGRRSRTAGAKVIVTFDIPVLDGEMGTGRRSLLGKAVRVILVKADAVVGKIVEHAATWAVPKLARLLEDQLWENRIQGWLRVTVQGFAAAIDQLPAGKPAFPRTERGLLFIHGTFSTAHGAFKSLHATDFFTEARKIYGANFYAFNHFTISKTPEENVEDLLDSLPDQDFEFDIITHSRGGLVVRELLEGSGVRHPKRARLKIGKVIMVASPSDGTPLASPGHWDQRLSFFANLLELLPENPFITGGAWLAEALKWFASNVLGNCSGLVAMDPQSDYIDALQGPPEAPVGTFYYALVSNFHPPRDWWARLSDMGVDAFYGGANDLVVPTEGGWKSSHATDEWIAGDRVACFGPGGNLRPDLPTAVHHGEFFGQPDAAFFMAGTLHGKPSNLPALDIRAILPTRSARRSRESFAASPPPARLPAADASITAEVVNTAVAEVVKEAALAVTGWDDEDTLYLTVISSENPDEFHENIASTLLLAQYGSARVAQPLYTKNVPDDGKANTTWSKADVEKAGSRFHDIIAMQKFMVAHTNGKRPSPYSTEEEGSNLSFKEPNEEFLKLLGTRLFNVLFNGQVRRLYDAVLYRHKRKRVNIIFTSMLSWLSDLPWELAYDPDGDCFLSTSNVRFLRNVLSPNPADKIERHREKLRILVASAQAIGASHISDEEESRRIKDSFRGLIERGLAEVDPIVRCTPDQLQARLQCTDDRTEYDVFHFIGHGYYDAKEGGYVEFVTDSGQSWEVTAKELVSILRNRGIRIVFLNACETGRGFSARQNSSSSTQGGQEQGANYNRGVAIELARQGIPAVVANQYSVVDSLASLFSLHFYSCLAHGLSIADAMREARIAVSYADEAEPMDWGVPVLFARNPNSTLCARRPYNPSSDSAVAGRGPDGPDIRRRRTEDFRRTRDTRVAVWCRSPSLVYRERIEDILAKITDSQNSFEFFLRKNRLPASIWRRHQKRGYLPAQSVIADLENYRVNRFSADVLICVTDQPLMSESIEELYYYSAGRVVVFSIWNFDPPIAGDTFKAALANHIAIALLDALTGVATGSESNNDPRHPIHTIGYFNDERSLEHIAGRMSIAPETMVEFKKLIKNGEFTSEQMESVNTLLTLYTADGDSAATAPAAQSVERKRKAKTKASLTA